MLVGRMLASAAALVLLAACAPETARPAAPKPLRPVTATFQGAPGGAEVTAVAFVDAEHGFVGVGESPYFAVGEALLGGPGELLSTSDGGRTWRVVGRTKAAILALDFLSPTQGFVLTGAYGGETAMTLLATTDGGRTLRALSHPPGYVGVAELRFTSPADGVISRQNCLDWTADGGRTWHASYGALPPPGVYGGPMPYATDFLSADVGFAAQAGSILRTTDGGASWHVVYRLPAASEAMFGSGPVAFATPTVGYAAIDVMRGASVGDVVLRTQDGGLHWRPMSASGYMPEKDVSPTGPPGQFSAVVGWGATNVAVMTLKGLAVSGDEGVHWRLVKVGSSNLGTDDLTYVAGRGLYVAPADGALVVVRPGGGVGQVWPRPTPDVAVDFFRPKSAVGLALTPEPALLESVDAGRSWRTIPLPRTSAPPSSVSFRDARHGWLIAAGGRALWTTSNGGRTWRRSTPAAGDPLDGQLFAGGAGLLLVQPEDAARPPELLATRDGGRRFVQRTLPTYFADGGTVQFASPAVGIAVSGLSVWETKDGGRSWHDLDLPTHLLAIGAGLTATAVDPQGDVWLLAQAMTPQGVYTPDVLYVHWTSQGWQEIRLPDELGFTAPVAVDAVGPRRVDLVTPAGLFLSTDRGRTWRNLTYPEAP